MTRDEKIEAFTMHIDGYSYREIGEKFGVSRQYVEQTLKEILPNRNSTVRRTRTSEKCIYSGLSDYIKQNNITMKKLMQVIGISHTTLNAKIIGEREFTITEFNKILEYTGMTFEECFKMKDE